MLLQVHWLRSKNISVAFGRGVWGAIAQVHLLELTL